MYHIKEKVVSFIEVKKSKFYCILMPCDDEKDIKNCLNQIKKEYPNATHYCYGAVIGGNNRSNDDGEPASTAGKPILEMLKNAQVDDTLAVVVRYFGGTLLGTAGLVKAYGQAAKDALALAAFTKPTKVGNYKLTVDYSLTNKIEYLLKNNATVTYRDYGEKVSFYYQSETDLTNQILQLTAGKAAVELINEEIVDK